MDMIMENKLFFAAVTVCIITHIVRLVYEILKDKKKLNPGKLSFAIIFSNMMLLWASWFALCSLDPINIPIAGIIRYAGISLAVTGLIIFLTGLLTIKTLESFEGDLITNGIYSKIRHPMYSGFILWLIGFPVYFGGVISLVLAFIFMMNVLFWRYLEEKELEKRFPAYLDYKKTTLF
jgi:protein-S-isoprenylcysteine O-methyltransferase Ste14